MCAAFILDGWKDMITALLCVRGRVAEADCTQPGNAGEVLQGHREEKQMYRGDVSNRGQRWLIQSRGTLVMH